MSDQAHAGARTGLPPVSHVRDLAPVREGIVSPDDLDLNGHMNAVYFFSAHVSSVRVSLAEVGIDELYVVVRRMGTFAAEHHIRYLSELRLGDCYSVRPRFLARTQKAAHMMSFLVNETDGALASVLEVVVVHIDQDTRRATEIPDDVATRIDAHIRDDDALGWVPEPRLTLRGRERA